MLFYSRKIDFFVFGRTIALIHFDADCGSYYVDALGGIIAHISDNNVSPRILDDFQLLKQNILSNLRDFSNSQKQFVHFTYNKESETIRSIYDEELSFENKPNDYLSSIWQEKTGVI